MTRWLVVLLALFALPAAALDGQATRPPDAAAMTADARLLEKVYGELHPGLYRYNTPAQIRGRFAALRRELQRNAGLPAAYIAFARLAAAIRCGHTYPNYWNQSAAVAAELFRGNNRVPFRFRWLDAHMVIVDGGTTGLPPGTWVKAINGVSTARILRSLEPLVPADGSNDAKRIDQLNVLGQSRYEAFDIFFPLVFPMPTDRFRLAVQAPSSPRPVTITVNALTDADRARAMPAAASDSPAWTLRYVDPATAILAMPTWALYDSHWDWQAWLDARFAEMKQRRVARLVIDLRDNGGGMDVGDEILAHLATAPLRFSGYRELLRYRTVPADMAPYLHTWDRHFFDWADEAQPYDDRFYRRVSKTGIPTDADVIAPRAPHFDGRVVVLVGPTNSSATFEFATRVKKTGLATLVGETTGGNLRGINGGAFFFLRLPRSGIELDVPLVGQFAVDDAPDAGLAPDVRAAWTRDAVIEGRDPAMAAALRLP